MLNISEIMRSHPNPYSWHSDHLNEECGVYAIQNHTDAAAHTVLGLHALQHRGQEAAGVVTSDEGKMHYHLAYGKVGEKFNRPKVIRKLIGDRAIGHNRYSTSGGDGQESNIQPIYAELSFGAVAVAHNGNLTNARTIKERLVRQGCIFRTSMDTEVIIHLIATSPQVYFEDAFIDALKQVKGGYSLVAMNNDTIYGIRDSHGVRPLSIGKLDDAYILTSETCALDIIGAEFVRDVKPGEMITLTKAGELLSSFPFAPQPHKMCIFEYVYFSRPDSHFEGKDIYQLRKEMGRQLAREQHADVDVIVPVPDSGVAAAIGYSEECGIPFELGIIRNHYVGRTFIEPSDHIRHLGVKLKHNANSQFIKGKRVLLIDDSIVRGTTSKKIVDMIRSAGAKEVHMRISSPPTTGACFYGIDTPSSEQLLASRMSVKEMEAYIGADSLAFISVDGLYKAVGEASGRNDDTPQYCDACFTGDYPIPLIDKTEEKRVA